MSYARPSRHRVRALVLLVSGASTVALAQELPTPTGTRPDCVHAEPILRMQAYGFDHWVRASSACAQPMTCQVASDVQPSETRIRLEPGAHEEVLLWRGSPANTFQARVDCTEAR